MPLGSCPALGPLSHPSARASNLPLLAPEPQISSGPPPSVGGLSSWTLATLRPRPRPCFPPSLPRRTSYRPWPLSP
eukprot:516618-Rhodomonas_salina.1